jgi:hypothetical protein
MTDDQPVEKYDGTVTWMGHTVTIERLAQLRSMGLNPWLTIVSGSPVPASPGADTHHAGCHLQTEHGATHEGCDCRCHGTNN